MKLRKSPEELVAKFDEVMPGPPATKRKMFGFPAGFVNGNMFMGLFEDSMILRLPLGVEGRTNAIVWGQSLRAHGGARHERVRRAPGVDSSGPPTAQLVGS
jgi:hypothetical protein